MAFTNTVTETITETETVEVEVPVYIEVEVPVNEGEIWVDSFTQPMSVDGIDILWVIDKSGSMRKARRMQQAKEAMHNILGHDSNDWREFAR